MVYCLPHTFAARHTDWMWCSILGRKSLVRQNRLEESKVRVSMVLTRRESPHLSTQFTTLCLSKPRLWNGPIPSPHTTHLDPRISRDPTFCTCSWGTSSPYIPVQGSTSLIRPCVPTRLPGTTYLHRFMHFNEPWFPSPTYTPTPIWFFWPPLKLRWIVVMTFPSSLPTLCTCFAYIG